MTHINILLENNKGWSESLKAQDPNFFLDLAKQQSPEYLWIGCADSRVPSTQLVGLLPGEMFVHRNVANVVTHTDFNCLSVVQFAVEILKVQHIIVCGHYDCGGVKAALQNFNLGLIDNWLRHVQDVMQRHKSLLDTLDTDQQRLDRLCELNVIEQVVNVSQTTVLQGAWDRGQDITVHGLIYGLNDGLLTDLKMNVSSMDELATAYERVISGLGR
jgi:carbonic anhydrase